jgi:multidrug efflux pump subunit AcrB
MEKIEEYVQSLDGVEMTATFVGRGALRFMLPYDVKSPNSSFSQLLGRVDDYRKVPVINQKIQKFIKDNFSDNEVQVRRFVNGPPVEYGVEAQFRGPDIKVLRQLVGQAEQIFSEAGAIDVRDDWRQQVRVLRPDFSESVARRTGITRKDLADAYQITYGGKTVSVYREDDDLLPIMVRTPIVPGEDEYDRMRRMQVYSGVTGKSLPLEQVASDLSEMIWEDPVIRREDQTRTMTAQCNPAVGFSSVLREKVKDKIEAIPIPPGYQFEWEGEYKKSKEAKEPLGLMFPICLLGMFIILICLFNSLREPIIIMLCVPLSIIGITAGLLLLQLPFGFMAILGFLGLSGMLIKNAIVLIDQVNLERREGKAPYPAILDSAVSRLRPVSMASGTTILGMTPLLSDPFYQVMAATVASGLVAATILTLVVVPLFFKLFYRVKCEE